MKIRESNREWAEIFIDDSVIAYIHKDYLQEIRFKSPVTGDLEPMHMGLLDEGQEIEIIGVV